MSEPLCGVPMKMTLLIAATSELYREECACAITSALLKMMPPREWQTKMTGRCSSLAIRALIIGNYLSYNRVFIWPPLLEQSLEQGPCKIVNSRSSASESDARVVAEGKDSCLGHDFWQEVPEP